MQDIADPYLGREHSRIKHSFLRRYLRDASAKVLSNTSVFNYVDGFAGPWSVSDGSDYSDSSFANAIDVLLSTKEHYKRVFGRDIVVRFFFCERNRDRFLKLKSYAASRQTEVDVQVFHGAFEEHLATIGSECRNGFTFTFIDPTGWNLRSADIAAFLRATRGDFLLNFMSEPINRHAGLPSVADSFARFLDDPTWRQKLADERFPGRQERKILQLLKRRLRELGAAKYVPDFPIHRVDRNRLQMRLVLGSKHPDAVTVFRQVQRDVEKEELERRNLLHTESDSQSSLFSSEQLTAMSQEHDGVGCQRYLRAAGNYTSILLRQLPSSLRFRDLAAAVMEHYPVRLTDMKDILAHARTSGLCTYELEGARQRKPKEATLIHPLKV